MDGMDRKKDTRPILVAFGDRLTEGAGGKPDSGPEPRCAPAVNARRNGRAF